VIQRWRGGAGRAALCAALLGALAPACDRGPGAPYACACTFMTDFDGESKVDVEVCSPPAAASAVELARGCAQSSAPGPVHACECRAVGDPHACEVGACRPLYR
jgi:hypothetical protein